MAFKIFGFKLKESEEQPNAKVPAFALPSDSSMMIAGGFIVLTSMEGI